MNLYLSSPNRDDTRDLYYELKTLGHNVFDFSNPSNSQNTILVPESYQEFNPYTFSYVDYISRPEWYQLAFKNRKEIMKCDVMILFLPCGVNEAVNWVLGQGLGKPTLIIGKPEAGAFNLWHLWATNIVESKDEIFPWLRMIEGATCRDCIFDDAKNIKPDCTSLEAVDKEVFCIYEDKDLPFICGFFKPGMYCRVCGCMDNDSCPGGCSWVAPGLCSKCEKNG